MFWVLSDVNFILIGYSETFGNSYVRMYTVNNDNDNYEPTSNNSMEQSTSQLTILDKDTNGLSSDIIQSLSSSNIIQSFKKITGKMYIFYFSHYLYFHRLQ